MKDGTPLRLALGPDPPAMPHDYALHDGQSDARAGELAGRVQTLEHAEQLLREAHVKARAIVAHVIERFAVYNFTEDLHRGILLLGAVLERVADEIRPDLLEYRGIAARVGQILDPDGRLGAF